MATLFPPAGRRDPESTLSVHISVPPALRRDLTLATLFALPCVQGGADMTADNL